MTDHSDEPPKPAADQEPSGAERVEPGEPETPPSRPRRSPLVRAIRTAIAIVIAIGAAIFVTVFTIDLGPGLRARAEREGSKFIERPMHIGRLSAQLRPGVFVVEDLMIEGLTPQDRPFLTAKRITVEVPWWTAFSRKLIIQSIAMTDWDMVVESFPNGRHNFPKFTRRTPSPKGPSRFTTTLRSVVALRGSFTYEDHNTPWAAVARNLDVQVYRPPIATNYLGRVSFSNGTVKIQSYEAFRTDMQSQFTIDGAIVHFDHMNLLGDGSRSAVTGDVDLGRWPEQTYQVRSKIDFPTQKEIFFHGQKFTTSGQGDFTGTFHLFKGGRELKGTFASPVAGVNEWRFPNLRGSVLWVPDRLEITNATADLYGGTTRFDYRMAPFGQPGVPTRATWDVEYRGVDISRLTDFLETKGLRLAGSATGKNRLEWPLSKWALKTGRGEVTVQPPPGIKPMTRELPADVIAKVADLPPQAGPFNSHLSLGYKPVAGRIVYALDPQWITLEDSWAATESTYVQFQGRTAFGERSEIPFHVTSLDWQESDRVLAGIMTTFGSPTGAVPIEGNGEFDGRMLASFSKPRIEGKFEGDRLRAWDVVWGKGVADVVIENSYAIVANAVLTSGGSEIRADGQFSLGYPRKDQGEEIDARVRLNRRPLVDLRHAFKLDDYPAEGLFSGDFHLYGTYERPFGFGKMAIDEGVAYGETFEHATSSLRFEGNGVRLDSLAIRKSSGTVTGAAFVGWEGDYSFNADGTLIPVESLKTLTFPQAQPSGLLQFSASGAGTFEDPRYDVKLRVDDLFAGDEGIGQLNGRLSLRGELLNLEMEAASPRLVVSGSGRIALTPEMDAELTVRFADTSLDPYVRFFEPRLSPFTTAVAGGTIRVAGELADVDHLVVETHVESLDLKLFDYRLKNKGTIDLSLDRHILKVDQLNLIGEGTELQVQGQVAFDRNEISVQASGDGNLGILQGFYRDLRSRGTAAIKAQIGGPLDKPVFAGSADVTDGRIRVLSIPNSIDAINGRLSFDADGIRLDDVAARVGEGDVRFGGRIGINGFTLGDLNLTATGERMRIRYPAGFVSTIDANLALQGTVSAPVLSGNVLVRDALWSRRIEATPGFFNLSGNGTATPAVTPAASAFPFRLDIDIDAPSSFRIENNIAKMVASADLKLQGTFDRPQLFGHVEIDRGDIVFEGNRYVVTRGGVDFFNASRIEPVFDIEAETRVRVPDQVYNITLGFSGTTSRFSYSLNSDPPLPQVDILSVLLGQQTDLTNAELRALRPGATQQSEEVLLRQAFSRLLTSPISAPVSRILGETLGIETVISPTFGTETDPLTPSARLILGRRLSNRAYLTFARALGGAQREQIIILEYDQSDRVGWVVTQNGDRTYALDFRVRHRF
jgi:TamB, inner membrane protein subunit of TAM complex